MMDRLAYLICMAVSFLFMYSVCGVSSDGHYKKLSLRAMNFFLVFLCLYWALIIGLQNGTGTDYYTYYNMFKNGCPGYYHRIHEYGFFYIADFIGAHMHPQWAYFFLALIQSIGFCIFFKYGKFERPDFFLLVYFTCATSFINSTNALRQFSAMYIFLAGIILLRDKKYIGYVLTIIVAYFFHISAIYLLALLIGRFWFVIKSKWILIAELSVSLVICFVGMDGILNWIAQFTPYKDYIGSSFATTGNRTDFLNIATKLIYIPFFIHLLFLEYDDTDYNSRFFINLGFFCFCIKMMGMSSYYISRFAYHFDTLAYIPLYYYLLWIRRCSMKKEIKLLMYFILLSVMLGPFVAKTCFFPVREYDYHSILSPFFSY